MTPVRHRAGINRPRSCPRVMAVERGSDVELEPDLDG